MNERTEQVLTKLKAIRARTDLALRPTKHLKTTFTDFSGRERELKIRYYQVQGIMHLIRFVLGDDTGLGKTLMVIASLCFLWEKDPNRKVIVLTKKSAAPQWVDEFSKFATGVKVYTCQGTAVQRKTILQQFKKETGPAVVVMGYRSAVQDFSSMQQMKDFILVADEASAFKNPKTQVHQVCRNLGERAERVWGLTATLIMNRLMEGYGIYQVVMPGLFQEFGKSMNEKAFMMHFAITKQQNIGGNRFITVITGYHPERIREFKEIIDVYYLGRPKHEVATDLPVLISKVVEVPLTPFQMTKYAEAINGLLETGKGDQTVEKEVTKLAAIAYCQEIVNHLELIDCEGDSPKLDALIDMLVEEGDFANDKIIVFTRFEKLVSLIMARLKKEKIPAVRVTGKETGDQRKAAMAAFQNPDSDVRVICITTAGSDAINLQAAKAIVCFDTPWSAGEFLQLLGRMIRIGSEHDRCYVIHLVAKNGNGKTVDHRVLEVMAKKMELVEAVLGKRLKGENDNTVIAVENEISDLFQSLRQDARGVKA